MLDQGEAKNRLPKGTMPSIVYQRGRYVRTLHFASSSRRDDAGPRRDNAKYRLPKGTIRLERFVSHRPLRETMLDQEGTKPSIVSRRGRYVRTLRFASSSLRDDAGPRNNF